MKKKLTLVLAIMLCFVVSIMTGCLNKKPIIDDDRTYTEAELHPSADYKGSLKIAAPNTTSHKMALNAFIESFKEKFPNIVITPTYLDINGYKAAVARVAASAESTKKYDTMYDLFWLPQDYLNDWYDLGILYSLQALMDQDDQIDQSKLIGNSVECTSINNKLYMMPRDYNQVVMYYNKDMFDAADVEYPASSMSASSFVEMLESLRDGLSSSSELNDYGSKYKDCVQNIIDCNIKWDSLMWPLLKSFGASVVNEAGEVTYASDETLNAIKWWKSLCENNKNQCRLAIKIEVGGSNPGQQFTMQQAPIYFQSRAVLSDITTDQTIAGQKYYGIRSLGVAGMPNFGGELAIGGGSSGYAMYSHTGNLTAAWQFLKHAVSLEGQNAYSATGDCVPVLSSLIDDKNAIWRNCLKDYLPSDFNHQVYVDDMDKYSSTRDFYKFIPFAAQSSILATMEESFNELAPLTNEATMRSTLKAKADKMTNYIIKSK